MKHLLFLLLFTALISNGLVAQNNARIEVDTAIVDENYREDQFYASITYNLLTNKPKGVSQSGFSSGFHIGFIRDMPINERRNIAIGVGLGLSTNSYNQTLRIEEIEPDQYLYFDLDETNTSFSKNKFSTYIVELPIEFRWRTSTVKSYDFWRVYTGIKFGYVFYNSSKFEGETGSDFVSNVKDFNNLQYGLTLGAGYDTINAYVYYGLNSLFDSNAKIDSEDLNMTTVRIGLIFYIL